jgi:hypothetical protein
MSSQRTVLVISCDLNGDSNNIKEDHVINNTVGLSLFFCVDDLKLGWMKIMSSYTCW